MHRASVEAVTSVGAAGEMLPASVGAAEGKRERNVGIDLLRIVSMMFVLTLHVLGHCGVLSGAWQTGAFHYHTAYFLEIAAYCAVNCYALISGYVGIRSRYKYTNIIMLWLQVFFYMGLITLIFSFTHPELVQADQIWNVFFPAVKNQYWYFTAYFVMSFFIPVFNCAVEYLPRRQMGAIVWASFILFSVFPMFFKTELFGTPVGNVFYVAGGYNMMWLSVLYVMGAYISKYGCFSRVKARYCFLIYLLATAVTWFLKFHTKNGGVTVNYVSPTILIQAVALLVGFAQLNLRPVRRAIVFLAPGAFGVFLIHTHPLIWTTYMLKRYESFGAFPAWKMILAVLLAVLCLYLICTAIDLGRHYLFKLLRIRKGIEWLEKKVTKRLWYEDPEKKKS